ncbi:hypothetical protein [Cohnella rhizosphaerae]|uniref:Lipoprotein n=1 Tax=Cohnella rhizosphaerae TaxID=1457232 RepID=A0A9X4KTJ2_9BACL|nr:hypothetical protein [Cohnella rhizosphaerae]MDG0810831.1 hypothetical protein [Cohnella rhizosphaerae]
MKLRITTAALLLSVSLAAAGCTNHDKNAESTSSASPSPEATQTASGSASASAPASGSPQETEAAPSASPSASAPASSPDGEAADAPGFLISLPSGSEFKPFMQISEQSAKKVEAVLKSAEWEKKESVAMSTSPSYKLSALAGDKETDVYYVWTADADAYELVKEKGSGYVKLSKKDSAALAKLLPAS